jgi:hypothetical protein
MGLVSKKLYVLNAHLLEKNLMTHAWQLILMKVFGYVIIVGGGAA